MPQFRACYAFDADNCVPDRISPTLIEAEADLEALVIARELRETKENAVWVQPVHADLVEHRPYVGNLYNEGIDGKKVAIVGYSHYGSPDHAGFSKDVVERFMSGEYKDLAFFWSIMGFFGTIDVDFWRKTMFFNFVPSTVGSDDDKYKAGTPTQMTVAKERFVRILVEHRPDVAIVFTKKPRWAMPNLDYRPLLEPALGFEKGTIRIGPTTVYRLRHPQFAKFDDMRRAVVAIMADGLEATTPPSL